MSRRNAHQRAFRWLPASPDAVIIWDVTTYNLESLKMASWKTLTRSDGATIYVQLAQIAKVEPASSGTGSRLTLIGVANEGGSGATIGVTQTPAQVLGSPETIVA